MKYTIRHLEPNDDSLMQFNSYRDAVRAAISASFDDSVWQVRDADGNILALVYMQAVYEAKEC